MSNLLMRALTGTVFVAVLLGSIYFHSYATAGIFLVFSLLGMFELLNMFQISWKEKLTQVILPSLAIYYVIVQIGWGYFTGHSLFLCVPIILIPLIELPFKKVEKEEVKKAIILMMGFVYIVIPFAMSAVVAGYENQQKELLICFFLILWSNDTFAYLTGKFLGRNKLIEHVSPKKTWEGLIGGIAFTILASYLCFQYLFPGIFNFQLSVIAALLVSLAATQGDLIQSYLKRTTGIKDSGNIFPGHGGVLDRFDGYLIALPAFYYLLHFLK